MKLWNFFGPSQTNETVGIEELQFPFNNKLLNPFGADPNYILTLGTEVGPYIPAIAPEVRNFSFRIYNKLYNKVYKRIIEDWNVKKEDEAPFEIVKLLNLIV